MRRESALVLLAAVGAIGAPAVASAAPPTATPVVFTRYSPDADGITYDEALVPVGARTAVHVRTGRDRTTVELRVRGLAPDHEFGVHVHRFPCGATGAAAGPHYQRVPDPVTPSVDPAYANPGNEIWLDVTTDADGDAHARSTVDWRIPPGAARSVVVHEEHTHTAPGAAGTAGARAACVDVPF